MSGQVQSRQPPSKTQQIFEGSGHVRGSENMSAPARWVTQMVQHLVALMLVAIGTALQSIFTRKNDKKRKQ
ncbi:MAG: hypothetical protein M1822_003643 [Bathelium mastoideum]|nr:MAG: hypothetical protein M1822_003643 [Bathelium mastoideum]